jgi:hypothetical protein
VDDLVEALTRGNTTEVKVVLTSVVAAVGVYQAFLMAVGYEKVRLRILAVGPASWSHRAIGQTLVVLAVLTGVLCLAGYGLDEGGVHAVAGIVVFAVLALKIGVVRRWRGLDPWLPALGISVLVLFGLIWATSAGGFLVEGPDD